VNYPVAAPSDLKQLMPLGFPKTVQ